MPLNRHSPVTFSFIVQKLMYHFFSFQLHKHVIAARSQSFALQQHEESWLCSSWARSSSDKTDILLARKTVTPQTLVPVRHCKPLGGTNEDWINHKCRKCFCTKLARAQNARFMLDLHWLSEGKKCSSVKPDSVEQTSQEPGTELIEDQHIVRSSDSNYDLELEIVKQNISNTELQPKYFQKFRKLNFSVQVILESSIIKGGKTFQL